MNHAQEILHTLSERFAATANAKQVFGEPIQAQGKTIVPVARVRYHLGAGWGGDKATGSSESGKGGGGGGGHLTACPAGVLEVSEAGTHFVRFFDPRSASMWAAAGFALGLLTRRRCSRRR